jgi:rhamnogalacturonyl hydrolase YesR
MRRVNDYWIANNNAYLGDRGWARATYFEGNMAMYAAFPEPSYLNYALKWAEGHKYSLYTGASTRNADNQSIGQTYIDLYRLDPVPQRIEMIDASISAMLTSSKIDDWWWIDALHMAMPVFAKLAVVHNDTTYTERMYEMYDWTKRRAGTNGLYNTEEHLWWRDASFKPPYVSSNGRNVYWSRGNGWVFAAHARTLEELDRLPVVDPHREEYVQTLQDMAEAIAAEQQADGFWTANLLDTATPAGPETSGTAFFTYGLAWGVRHHILSPHKYMPVIARAWKALTETAIGKTGKLGYIQPVGVGPTTSPTANDHYDFGVGAFLLAGSEVYRLAHGHMVAIPSEYNLALQGQAIATTQQVGNEADHAIDNDLTTRWSAQGYPQSLEIDLGTAQSVDGIEIAPLVQRPYQFVVETKAAPDAEWEIAVDDTANAESGPFLTRTFGRRKVSAVRLTVTGLDASAAYTDWISIAEFRVLSTPRRHRR